MYRMYYVILNIIQYCNDMITFFIIDTVYILSLLYLLNWKTRCNLKIDSIKKQNKKTLSDGGTRPILVVGYDYFREY